MAKKYYPVIRSFDVTGGSQQNTIVDIGQTASRLNHRLMRQTRIYTANVKLRSDSALNGVDVYALRNDWMLCNSVKMAYKAYQQATSATRAMMSEKQLARWEDFRIDHGISPVNISAPILYGPPTGGPPPRVARAAMFTGEFVLSTVDDASGTTHTFTLGTAASNQYQILNEYDNSADTDSDPGNLLSAGVVPYGGLEDDVTGTIVRDLEDNGNNPPYDSDSIQGSHPWVRVGTLGVGAAHSTLSTGQFEAPLGLILIDGYVYGGAGEGTEEGSISVHLKAGDYKGVHAPSMLE